jgi:hypothetical protein
MPTAELPDVGLNGDGSPRSRVDVGHSWDLPISPTEPATHGDTFLGEEAFDATPADEHLFPPAERSDIYQILMDFGLQRKLIVGAAIVATLAVGVLAYIFWPVAGEKKGPETAEASPGVQSEPIVPGQAAPRIPEPSLSAPTAFAWPDLPPSGTIGSFAATASVGNSETRHAPATQNPDIVFLQRPGVNIRSTPAANGFVVGTAPKGTRFKVAKRDGDWIQVESDRLKGWINSQFLGPNHAR